MQLDKTHIAVRERTLLDTLDLSVHVTRVYALPLLVTLAAGGIPLLLLNQLLLGWMTQDVFEDGGFPVRFVWHLSVQVFLQAPLASTFATGYLGQAVFFERPSWRDVLRGVWQMLPQIALCQVLLRGVGAGLLLELALDRTREFGFFQEGFLLFVLVVYAIGVRALRPFANEIILLERNPLTAQNQQILTARRRSSMLHGPNAGDLVVRWVSAALMGIPLVLSVYGLFLFLSGLFLGTWEQGPLMVELCLPLAMWLVAGYLTVFRFLSYLDVRIRQEGWEVELRLRAEAARMRGKLGEG